MAHPILPADLSLGKVKLKVSDLQRSLLFYEEVLGFQVLRQVGRTAELSADGKTVLVELEEIPDAVITRPRTVSGLYHYAILLPSRKDLGLMLNRLMEKGIRVGQSDHDVSEALYIDDPDYNGIEIYRDRPRTEWAYNENNQVVMGGKLLDIDGILREAEGHPWKGMPAGTTIGHVHLHVNSLEKAKWFYCDVMGFDMMLDSLEFRALFVSAGGYHHHLGLNVWAGVGAPATPANGTGLQYFTIVLPNQEEVVNMVKRLEDNGISVDKQGKESFVIDPSGIQVRLVLSD